MDEAYVIRAAPLPQGKEWSLVVDGIGVSQVRRLEQAEDEMRAAVCDVTGATLQTVQMRVELALSADDRVQYLDAQAEYDTNPELRALLDHARESETVRRSRRVRP